MNEVIAKWLKEVKETIQKAKDEKEYSWISMNDADTEMVLTKLSMVIELMEVQTQDRKMLKALIDDMMKDEDDE